MTTPAVPWNPRPYQLEALEFALARRASGLLLDPGLGKTSTFLAYISLLLERKDIRRALVVAPLRVAQTVWPVEARKWKDFNHLRVCDLCEKTDYQMNWLLNRGYEVYVINPESLYKVLNPGKETGINANVGNPWGFDLLLSDESTRFADTQTARFKMLKPALGNFSYRNIATGTPTPNGLAQLFGQCYFLDDGRALGAYITHFRQMYMIPHPEVKYTYIMLPQSREKIFERTKDLLLRMRAKDHLEMPELIDNIIEVELPPEVRKEYDFFEKEFLYKVLDETIPAFNKASLGIKCRQISNGFIYHTPEGQVLKEGEKPRTAQIQLHDEKLKALENLIEEMQGRPLLVMYEFIADGQRIMDRFPQAINVTGSKDINKVVRDFNAGRIPVLIGHPKSAGHGLNLQEACSDICWFGIMWDLELYLQAIARIWRQGQESPFVKNHIILARNTTDEGVLGGLLRKGADQDDVDQALIKYAKRRLGL
jgi:SNF2 family DNA or RNA helicase